MPAPTTSGRRFEAVLFDLDGVLTSTTALHKACWKEALDEVLGACGLEPFDAGREYVALLDGKPRYDGVRDFLRARGIEAGEDEVRRIGDAKQALVERALARGGAEAFAGSVLWVRALRDAGVRTAVVSSSSNAGRVLAAAGIAELFELTVDGADVARLGLCGKPSPDGFLEAARRMAVAPGRAVVVEDALAGVAAGAAGRFGLVIGVARHAARADLHDAGAHVVVDDLGELV